MSQAKVKELLDMSTTSFSNVVVGEKLSKHDDQYASCGDFLSVHGKCKLHVFLILIPGVLYVVEMMMS